MGVTSRGRPRPRSARCSRHRPVVPASTRSAPRTRPATTTPRGRSSTRSKPEASASPLPPVEPVVPFRERPEVVLALRSPPDAFGVPTELYALDPLLGAHRRELVARTESSRATANTLVHPRGRPRGRVGGELVGGLYSAARATDPDQASARRFLFFSWATILDVSAVIYAGAGLSLRSEAADPSALRRHFHETYRPVPDCSLRQAPLARSMKPRAQMRLISSASGVGVSVVVSIAAVNGTPARWKWSVMLPSWHSMKPSASACTRRCRARSPSRRGCCAAHRQQRASGSALAARAVRRAITEDVRVEDVAVDEVVLVQVERGRGRGQARERARERDGLLRPALERLPPERRLALVQLAAPDAGRDLVTKEVVVRALARDVVARVRLEPGRIDARIDAQAHAARVAAYANNSAACASSVSGPDFSSPWKPAVISTDGPAAAALAATSNG